MSPAHSEIRQQHDALTAAVGYHPFEARTRIEITGQDRAKFLHGMCTNDILRLESGQGCEAFLTDVQGKVAAYVYVLCRESSLVLETVGNQAADIIAGLDKYLIREDVGLHDASDRSTALLVAGVRAEVALGDLIEQPCPRDPCQHVSAELAGIQVMLARIPFTGPACFFLACPADQRGACCAALESVGALPCDAAAVQIARIEARTPLYGCDITRDNLPQEVDRDSLAISFTKGCYLGQETVARIDALGHVNRTLTGLRFHGQEVPPPGTQILSGEKTVARVTSACWSLKWNAPLAMAYVRRGHNRPGTSLNTDFGDAEVLVV